MFCSFLSETDDDDDNDDDDEEYDFGKTCFKKYSSKDERGLSDLWGDTIGHWFFSHM